MMILQNKNVCQLVWHLKYIDTAVEGSELYCYNTEGDRNSFVSQESCRMDVTTKTACLHQNSRTAWEKLCTEGYCFSWFPQAHFVMLTSPCVNFDITPF